MIEEFYEKYKGQTKGYPTDSQYPGQCLSIVKLFIKEKYGIDPPASGSGSAYGYWSNFPDPLGEVLEKVSGVTPQADWIAIWNTSVGDGYGHIDIVKDNITSSGFRGVDQNWGGMTTHLVDHNYNNIVGYLKPKGDEMTDEEFKEAVWNVVNGWYRNYLHTPTDKEINAHVDAIMSHSPRKYALSDWINKQKNEDEFKKNFSGNCDSYIKGIREINSITKTLI